MYNRVHNRVYDSAHNDLHNRKLVNNKAYNKLHDRAHDNAYTDLNSYKRMRTLELIQWNLHITTHTMKITW